MYSCFVLVKLPKEPLGGGHRKTFLAIQKVKSKTGSLEDRLIFYGIRDQ